MSGWHCKASWSRGSHCHLTDSSQAGSLREAVAPSAPRLGQKQGIEQQWEASNGGALERSCSRDADMLPGAGLVTWIAVVQRTKVQELKLGTEGLIPLEIRFLHDPSQAHGFVGAALASNIIHFTKVLVPHQPPSPLPRLLLNMHRCQVAATAAAKAGATLSQCQVAAEAKPQTFHFHT